MNHGKCINCYWYKEICGQRLAVNQNGLQELPGKGVCGMQTHDTHEVQVNSTSYCPDYFNWKREGKRYYQEQS